MHRASLTYSCAAEVDEKTLPIAIVLGHHPPSFRAGLTKLDQDEYRVAGGVMGEGLEVTPSESLGSELLVPAQAEIILEGEIVRDRRTIEGPFGEFTGYNGPQRLSWLVEVKAVTARHDGIIVGVLRRPSGEPLCHYPHSGRYLRQLSGCDPQRRWTISWVDSGGPPQHDHSLKKKTEGEQLRAAMAAFSQSNFIKHVSSSTTNIDPGNLNRSCGPWRRGVQWTGDVNVLKVCRARCSIPPWNTRYAALGSIIDATKPTDRAYAIKAQPPEEIVRKVDLTQIFFPVR
jgi:UbiD family decarboxylase